ncbi:MAG: polysaccharide biosynthesis/export family protein [Candidatus Acidiferrales bacterium]
MKRRIEFLMMVVAVGIFAGASQPAWAQSAKSKPVAQNYKGASPMPDDWRSAATTAAQAINPNEYTVGEADILEMSVWKEPELTQRVVVRPDGKVALPLVNEMKVAGMTPFQIQQLLTDKLKAYLVAPQVTITVAEIHSKTVYVTGEVNRAGEYPLLTPITVLQLIARAGGLTAYANKKAIFVMRNVDGHQVRYSFDYSSVIHGKNSDQNIELRTGDTVVVP